MNNNQQLLHFLAKRGRVFRQVGCHKKCTTQSFSDPPTAPRETLPSGAPTLQMQLGPYGIEEEEEEEGKKKSARSGQHSIKDGRDRRRNAQERSPEKMGRKMEELARNKAPIHQAPPGPVGMGPNSRQIG